MGPGSWGFDPVAFVSLGSVERLLELHGWAVVEVAVQPAGVASGATTQASLGECQMNGGTGLGDG
jgi:hypothetical protein